MVVFFQKLYNQGLVNKIKHFFLYLILFEFLEPSTVSSKT